DQFPGSGYQLTISIRQRGLGSRVQRQMEVDPPRVFRRQTVFAEGIRQVVSSEHPRSGGFSYLVEKPVLHEFAQRCSCPGRVLHVERGRELTLDYRQASRGEPVDRLGGVL